MNIAALTVSNATSEESRVSFIYEDDEDDDDDHRLRPPTEPAPIVFKALPKAMIQSIEEDRRRRGLPHSQSASDFLDVHRSSIDTTDDDAPDNDETTTTTTTNSSFQHRRNRSLFVTRTKRSPSDVRVTLYADDQPNDSLDSQSKVSRLIYGNEMHASDPSLVDSKTSKQTRMLYVRRALLADRFNRLHSSFSSSTTLRSLNPHRSIQNLSQRFSRRHVRSLPRTSKWHFVRRHLSDIAMMNEQYARMKIIESDLRWNHIREQVRKQVLDMREISILRQQEEGLLTKTLKTNFDLKSISVNDVIHVEHDGRMYSIGTRDLVLGRSSTIGDEHLDAFAQLEARRKFQVKQNLLKQQQGRTRLKKNIAFSFCFCNLSFIVLMFAAMFIFATKTLFELKSREFL